VLSKPLRYAVDVEVISHMPKIGLPQCRAAKKEGREWYAAKLTMDQLPSAVQSTNGKGLRALLVELLGVLDE